MKRNKNLKLTIRKAIKLSAVLLSLSVVGLAANNYINSAAISGQQNNAMDTGHGDVDTLKTALATWRENYEAKGGSPELLKVSVGYSKVTSTAFTRARGQMDLNLKSGELAFQAVGLDNGEYSLWLVDSQGGSVAPKPTDKMLQIGRFTASAGKAQLSAQLQRSQLLGFTLDSVVISKLNQTPDQATVITGAPDLMHKLYYADKPWLTTALADFKPQPANETAFSFLLPKAAQADTVGDLTPVLGALVAQGRQIFHNETFAGNGRTCGTCHRADNNFTLDPNYINKLPASDPLFVAETNPALVDLENPTLLRKHGLILTNVDGPGIDVFRSVPHTLALATSVKTESLAAGGDFAADAAFANATGWSGDGAPGSGSLREFTLGAVAQHFPKSLTRVQGVDFRVPTATELDQVEAYMLSLGRSKDYPLYKLIFNDPLIQAGKLLFDTKQNPCTDGSAQVVHLTKAADLTATPPVTAEYSPATCNDGNQSVQGITANCNGCHQNAGARSSTTKANPTRNTGVERMKIHPARLIEPNLAYDGGFGVESHKNCGPNGDKTCFGDGRFNTPPLIEAADTAPYFHNNAVSTLEEAIASYNSDGFNASPASFTSKMADRRVKLDSTQIVAAASFLRAINALENIRMSDQLDNQAKQIANNATARELAKLAYEENLDAIQVLKEGVLGNAWQAVKKLEQASYFQNLAQLAPIQSLRNSLLQQALLQKQEARSLIASCNPNATVTVSSGAVATPANEYSCTELGL